MMKISSLDIRKQEFSIRFRGYDQDEVDAFLSLLSDEWQELVDDHRRATDRIREQELKLEHYQKVEEALEEALKTARTTSRETIEQAERRAQAMIEEAEVKAAAITSEAEEDRRRIRRETAGFRTRQQEIVAKMRAFLVSELEILGHFDAEEAAGPLRLMHATTHESAEKTSREDGNVERDEAHDQDDVENQQEDHNHDEEAPVEEPAWHVNDMYAEDPTDEITKIRRILDAMDDEEEENS